MSDEIDMRPEYDFSITSVKIEADPVTYDPPKLIAASPDARWPNVTREIVEWPGGRFKVRGVKDGKLIYFVQGTAGLIDVLAALAKEGS